MRSRRRTIASSVGGEVNIVAGVAPTPLTDAVSDRVSGWSARRAHVKQFPRSKLAEHARYIRRYGEDTPEIRDWVWGAKGINAQD